MANSPASKRDFFVSFNKADRAWATWIAWVLEEAGYSVFFQDWDFRGNFVEHMNRAHVQAERTLAVLSDHYFGSDFTFAEWSARLAQDPAARKDRLVPVKVGPLTGESILGPIGYADVTDCDEDEARRRLLGRVKKAIDPDYRDKPEKPPGFPGRPPRQIQSKPEFPSTEPIADQHERPPITSGSPVGETAPHNRDRFRAHIALTTDRARTAPRASKEASMSEERRRVEEPKPVAERSYHMGNVGSGARVAQGENISWVEGVAGLSDGDSLTRQFATLLDRIAQDELLDEDTRALAQDKTKAIAEGLVKAQESPGMLRRALLDAKSWFGSTDSWVGSALGDILKSEAAQKTLGTVTEATTKAAIASFLK